MKKKGLVSSLMIVTAVLLFAVGGVLAGVSAGSTGWIEGKVTDAITGKAVSGAMVYLPDTGANAITGSNGTYKISAIATGSYTVSCTRAGYQDETYSSISVSAGSGTHLNFSITPVGKVKEPEIVEEPLTEVEYDVEDCAEMIAPVTKGAHRAKKDASGAYMPQPSDMPYPVSGEGHVEHNTEEYDRIYENEFMSAVENPLSTFSIDVDTASYANARRFINQSQLPPKDAVRIEEFINYYTYDYPEPDGDHPFSITTEISTCPWNEDHRLVHLGLQGKRIDTKDLPPTNLVFLLDVSGSMNNPNKLPLLKAAFKLLVSQLRPEDRVAIVVYAGAAGMVLPSTKGTDKEAILGALDSLQAGGSTAGGAGIQLAYKTAVDNLIKNGNNRVILATDGDFNIGQSSDGELVRMIEERRNQGVFLTILGFGMGNYKDSKMEKLADKGNGNYAYIDSILEAKKVLVSEMGGTLFTIAKDVKIQIEFNPAKVKGYRLIGYENRMLNKEDFNDDTKDAGELGAGHTVTALYEIIQADSDEELPGVDPLKYQSNKISDEAKKSPELMTVKLRYKKPDSDKSKLIEQPLLDKDVAVSKTSDNFRFSAAVAQFGLLLRDSKFKGKSSFEAVVKLGKNGKGKDKDGYRTEFLQIVEKARLLKETR